MIRISSGEAKNKKLKIPNVEGFRAVQEIVKQSVFGIISNRIADATCLDLYAGSGAMGLEALSRGAKWCDFVDEHKNSVRTIKDNIEAVGFADKSEVFHSDAIKYCANTGSKYDFIFIDPFYNDLKHKFLLKQVGEVLKKEGTVFFLHGTPLNINDVLGDSGLKLIDQRKFGASLISALGVEAQV